MFKADRTGEVVVRILAIGRWIKEGASGLMVF
jgi:hypothetical protein